MLPYLFDGAISPSESRSGASQFGKYPSPSSSTTLECVINHVFLPIYDVKHHNYATEHVYALVGAVHTAARAYNRYIDNVHTSNWPRIIKMLENLQVIVAPSAQSKKDDIISQLGSMKTGDILVFPSAAHGVLFRRQDHRTLFEVLCPEERRADCWTATRSYPWLAIEIPHEVFASVDFQRKIASHPSEDWPTRILRGVGHPVEPKRITKRTRSNYTFANVHRRSAGSVPSLWFLIRFTIQSSLDDTLGHSTYKTFILFFMCNFASQTVNTNSPSILLHSMSAKILRRFRKLGSSAPLWLCETVSDTCTSLSQTLDQRWQESQATQSSSPHWLPSELDLIRDTHFSLSRIYDYVLSSHANRGSDPLYTPFLRNSPRRGSLADFLFDLDKFLSPPGWLSLAHDDIHVTLYDVEWAVGEGLDDWAASVTNVNEACKQLEGLIHRYQNISLATYHHRSSAYDPGFGRPSDLDHLSIMYLTVIELWIALDKLVLKEVPILVDYSPEVPLELLHQLLLRDVMSIHRFCRAYQYLFARHNQAQPGWSVFSEEFTEDSFPCRYYDNSPQLQHLTAQIPGGLPSEPLHTKVVVFELQCPVSFDTWRSVTYLISRDSAHHKRHRDDIRVLDNPTLKPHSIRCKPSWISLYSCPSGDGLCYVYDGPLFHCLELAYELPSGPYKDSKLQGCLDSTTHTSNEVLATQTNCDPNLSLDEFIAFAHLRSGGSLQWFNILRELRSRTLDFRHQEVYLLLTQASTEVGPLDGTGGLLWHQELQDVSFCHVLLSELESLFIDIGEASSDGSAMAMISSIAGVLASQASEDISERAIKLLRNLRRRTFDWVQELVYNVKVSPMSEESWKLLRDMAAVCRSTFDMGSTMGHKLFCSSHDIEAALACAMLIWTIVLPESSGIPSVYSQVLLNRDRRLSLVLEGYLMDAIQADATDLGVDRAVQLVWPGYRSSPFRWEPLQSPKSGWLACETMPSEDRNSQTVHINLLDGSLFVDGRPVGNMLPSAITNDPIYRELFGSRNLMVVASDLPGMDFVTMSAIHNHYVHFAFETDNDAPGYSERKKIALRAQNEDTDYMLELIPREVLQEVLPKPLVEGRFHWLNLSTSTIEIRPIEKPWEQSRDNWTIDLKPGQSHVKKGSQFLMDKQSPTWKMISSCFQCLEDPEYLIIATSSADATQSQSLRPSVTLPRYGLSFFNNKDDNLESRDFQDMVYDEDQCIGTLTGLVSRLVLRPKAQVAADLIPKLVLIPYSPSLSQDGHRVHVKLPSSGPVRYYTYQVDSELGCLKGIVSLESRLYLARLHVRTSGGCRPDPLTGRTGVEEAISLILSAGTRQQTDGWCSMSQSPQIRFAFAKIQHLTYPPSQLPTEAALLHESYLFPSEIAASVQHPRREFDRLLQERPAPDLCARNELPRYGPWTHGLSRPPNISPLRQLFASLQTNKVAAAPPFQYQYISRLDSSVHHFQTTDRVGVTPQGNSASGKSKSRTEILRNHYVKCRANYMESLETVKTALGPKTQFERILEQCGQWPRVTPFILFRSLASTSPVQLPEKWKKCLIDLALLALDLQRARRLLRFALDNLEEELYNDLENEGCDGWDPAKHPDWLLIQLQGNFFIRPVQADVAKEMRIPPRGKNIVMQVNMGEGKTSVIIPICAAALADGKQLVRVVVPKALVPQTLQILTDRLSGLITRPIYHLTFSRDEINAECAVETVDRMHTLVLKCMEDCGIVVMQPGHVLSLKLACVERQLCKKGIRSNSTLNVQKTVFERAHCVPTSSLSKLLIENTHVASVIGEVNQWHREDGTARESINGESAATPGESIESEAERPEQLLEDEKTNVILKLQKFLQTHVRDVLDESDDVLRPQFQLIYAIGNQHPFEGSPDRWVIAQRLLGLTKRHACLLSPMIRSYGSSSGSFPQIYILQAKGGEQLISSIAEDVLDGRLPGLSFHPEVGLKGAIREFILRKDIQPDIVKLVEEYARQGTSWSSLLLLRGLLAYNILLFALTQRRWRVDYGLDPSSTPRTMLAIPYRAKDVPAEKAEFGHPDVTILLTCLSYYYRGLNEEQLKISFEVLLQQDDPSSEYALWLEDCDTGSMPNPPRNLSGVNIRSSEQWNKHLFPLFSRNKGAIDLYLSKIVFPSHAKEFSQRIVGSSWDIAEQKNHPVTGISGTSDGHYLLPTSMVQHDPDNLHQTGTNARVLAHLLQPENSSYTVTTDENGERWTTLKLLNVVVAQKPKIRVLLDVGAQILDLSNLQVAKAWLDRTDTAGAIYFSEDDKLMVLNRNGRTQPLSSSPLAQQLHRCVAYLDDAHTRGTDLKFPDGFRAAVTLGHKVTKDRLVQGCMRMRKLGHGHSVTFFAPHEVDQRIRALVSKEDQKVSVTTSDILHWSIHETWSDMQRQAPYWAQQGISHQSRYETWSRFCQYTTTPEQLAVAWVQPELKSLADMYIPNHSPQSTSSIMKNLPPQIRDCCASLDVLSLPHFRMDEEQEREVSREIEREREVERPPRASPAPHSLHPAVIQFVRMGVVPSAAGSVAFRHVFATDVTAASGGPHPWSAHILATADFCETIEENQLVRGRLNYYQRPVQWVLSGKWDGRDALVLLSPFEAGSLMPAIRISEYVRLHLYIPRTTKRMKPSDDLRLHSVPPLPSDWIPPWTLIDQLNVFAGQLYLNDHTSYIRLCRFLGIHTEDLPQKPGTVVARNWFNYPGSSNEEIKNRFEGTSLPLVMELLAVRRGVGFARTHMGRILEGWPLTEEDFQSLPDPAPIPNGRFEQEQLGVTAELSSVGEDDDQGSASEEDEDFHSAKSVIIDSAE